MKKAIKERLREPSTWAGLAALASIFGGAHAGEYAQLVQAVGAVAAGLAVVKPEARK